MRQPQEQLLGGPPAAKGLSHNLILGAFACALILTESVVFSGFFFKVSGFYLKYNKALLDATLNKKN